MTEKELEKEAKQSYLDNTDHMQWDAEGEFDYTRGYINAAEPREKRIEELEQQIEKMKNWCNCKNYQQCLIELAEQGKGMKPSECCVNCKKWEIKENEIEDC